MMGDMMTAGHSEAVLLLGGNEGDVAATFAAARALLERRVGAIVRASSLHRTAPWGEFTDDAPADFLNQVLVVKTLLEPFALLDATQGIEKELGRNEPTAKRHPERSEGSQRVRLEILRYAQDDASRQYSSRPIDIDILYYDDLQIDTPRLKIPHPLIAQREFVLNPLKEVAPERLASLADSTPASRALNDAK